MSSLLIAFGVGCGLCLLLMPPVMAWASRLGLVDRPDGRRKIHHRTVPLAGGLAILIAATAGAAAALFPREAAPVIDSAELWRLVGLLLAAVLICALGIADDYGQLRGRHKLMGQTTVALILVQFGWLIPSLRLFDGQIDLGLLAMPFTVLWLLATINSLNLMDGMDGLLGSLGLILCAALAGLAAIEARDPAAVVAAALAGALLSFLHYNRPPASAFLGDAGSMLIGLVIGALTLHGATAGPAPLPVAIPLALLTIPFLDTAAAILRRKLTGRSIYVTDRGHLHHCLLRAGYSPLQVLTCVAGLALVCAAGAVAGLVLEQELLAFAAALAVVSILVGTRLFGYTELVLAWQNLRRLASSLLHGRRPDGVKHTEVRLQGSADWAELWSNLIVWAGRLHLKMVRLNVNAPALHEGYHARWDCPHTESEHTSLWRAELPLTVDGQQLGTLEIVGERNGEPAWDKMATVLELVEHFEAEASDVIRKRGRQPATKAPEVANGATAGLRAKPKLNENAV